MKIRDFLAIALLVLVAAAILGALSNWFTDWSFVSDWAQAWNDWYQGASQASSSISSISSISSGVQS